MLERHEDNYLPVSLLPVGMIKLWTCIPQKDVVYYFQQLSN